METNLFRTLLSFFFYIAMSMLIILVINVILAWTSTASSGWYDWNSGCVKDNSFKRRTPL